MHIGRIVPGKIEGLNGRHFFVVGHLHPLIVEADYYGERILVSIAGKKFVEFDKLLLVDGAGEQREMPTSDAASCV